MSAEINKQTAGGMRVGYIKDESGKLVRKWVKAGEEGENPDVLYQVASQFGDYIWTDEEHMDEAKDALLEKMLNTIRNLAKLDAFWIVKTAENYRKDAQNSPLCVAQGISVEEYIPQQAKEGKCTVALKLEFPQFNGFYKWNEAEKLRKQLDACCGHL